MIGSSRGCDAGGCRVCLYADRRVTWGNDVLLVGTSIGVDYTTETCLEPIFATGLFSLDNSVTVLIRVELWFSVRTYVGGEDVPPTYQLSLFAVDRTQLMLVSAIVEPRTGVGSYLHVLRGSNDCRECSTLLLCGAPCGRVCCEELFAWLSSTTTHAVLPTTFSGRICWRFCYLPIAGPSALYYLDSSGEGPQKCMCMCSHALGRGGWERTGGSSSGDNGD